MPEHIAASFEFLVAERAFAFYFLGSLFFPLTKPLSRPHYNYKPYLAAKLPPSFYKLFTHQDATIKSLSHFKISMQEPQASLQENTLEGIDACACKLSEACFVRYIAH
jgi:hypothetical protein